MQIALKPAEYPRIIIHVFVVPEEYSFCSSSFLLSFSLMHVIFFSILDVVASCYHEQLGEEVVFFFLIVFSLSIRLLRNNSIVAVGGRLLCFKTDFPSYV